MAKKVLAYVKLQCPAGKANPSPPVGPALGQHGVNIMEFCKQFNARTQGQEGMVIPVVISIYQDRTFSFVTKTPPASILIKKAASLKLEKKPGSGASEPGKETVGTITFEQAKEIGRIKAADLNGNDDDANGKIIAGTARSMGVKVTGL